MGDITVTMTKDACGAVPCPAEAYIMRNFKALSINQRTPNQTLAIPQQACCKTIVIKTEGNITSISVGWTILSEMCTVVAGQSIKTVQQQILYLLDTVQNKTIKNEYTLDLNSDWKVLNVKPDNLRLDKTDETPITYNATWDFVIGTLTSTISEG